MTDILQKAEQLNDTAEQMKQCGNRIIALLDEQERKRRAVLEALKDI
jgi:hypothetical protein